MNRRKFLKSALATAAVAVVPFNIPDTEKLSGQIISVTIDGSKFDVNPDNSYSWDDSRSNPLEDIQRAIDMCNNDGRVTST